MGTMNTIYNAGLFLPRVGGLVSGLGMPVSAVCVSVFISTANQAMTIKPGTADVGPTLLQYVFEAKRSNIKITRSKSVNIMLTADFISRGRPLKVVM